MSKDMWNERFALEAYAYGVEPNDFLKEHEAYLKRNSQVLCLAEGEGRNAVYLAKQGHEVTGIDFSEEGRTKALELAAIEGVDMDYILTDLEAFQYGVESWDAVIFVFAHTMSDVRFKIYDSVKHCLKPGGIFLLEAYTPDQLLYKTGGPRDMDMLIPISELKQHFKGFEVIHALEVEREIHEGEFHTGLSSVSQFLVRKPF